MRARNPLLLSLLSTTGLLWLAVSSGCQSARDLATTEPRAPASITNPSATDVLTTIILQIDAGDFAGAEQAIAAALARATPAEQAALAFERERMQRIRLDFSRTTAEIDAQLAATLPDLKAGEREQWTASGLLESMLINGERRYFKHAVKNLFYISDEALARRQPRQPRFEDDAPLYAAHAYHQQIIQAATSGQRAVLPRRVRITQQLVVDADAVPAGETVRAWLPFPRAIAGQQSDIHLLASTPESGTVAPPDTLQRTVYLERVATAGEKTRFTVDYELTLSAQYQHIDPERVQMAPITDDLAPFLAERPPHVQFTPALRQWSQQVVGAEKNPYRIAQKLFAAVADIPWAIAREYSTISNISDYALHAGHADCGQKTLLLITALRLNGIPARWQSGWQFSGVNADSIDEKPFDTMHDWGMFYLAPYGWLPMDVTHGVLDASDPAVAWFYLGGVDNWRVAFNDDYSRDFVPAKQHPRSETVDLQRGEVEWRGGNLYFNQWDYQFSWSWLEPAPAPGK